MVLLETRQLQEANSSLLSKIPGGMEEAERNPSVSAQLLTNHLSALRNRRCLLAYHRFRTQWLQRRFWAAGGTLDLVLDDDKAGGHGLRSRISPSELAFLRAYASLVTEYKAQHLDLFDLCAPLATNSSGPAPPKELMVTVVAQVDAKEVMTEGGTLNLRRGEPMRVRRSEIEPLLVRGWVAIVD